MPPPSLLARILPPSVRPALAAGTTCLLLGVASVAAAAATTGAPAATTPEGTWPLDPTPVVAERFAPPAQRWQAGHRGVDLVGRAGQPVLSALPGRVAFAGRVAGKPVVVVAHDGTGEGSGGGRRTTYEPVVPLVGVGDRVAAGDRLGLLVTSHSHCLPAACLHWGLRRGATYLDPLALVGADRRIRLLPLG